jgi:hypothetical protein
MKYPSDQLCSRNIGPVVTIICNNLSQYRYCLIIWHLSGRMDASLKKVFCIMPVTKRNCSSEDKKSMYGVHTCTQANTLP